MATFMRLFSLVNRSWFGTPLVHLGGCLVERRSGRGRVEVVEETALWIGCG